MIEEDLENVGMDADYSPGMDADYSPGDEDKQPSPASVPVEDAPYMNMQDDSGEPVTFSEHAAVNEDPRYASKDIRRRSPEAAPSAENAPMVTEMPEDLFDFMPKKTPDRKGNRQEQSSGSWSQHSWSGGSSWWGR